MPIQELSPGKYQFRVATGRDLITGNYGRATRHHAGPPQTGPQPPKSVRDAYAAFLTEVRSGLASKRQGATLNDAWDVFLGVAELAPLTRQDYVAKWDLHVRPGLGKTAMADLTAMDCTRLYNHLTATGRAPTTVRKVHALVRNACKTAVNELGWIKVNPAINARLPRTSTQDVDAPEPEHVDRLIVLATADNPELALFLELAIGMGGRRGEVIALRRSAIEDRDDEGMVLHVRAAAYRLTGDPAVRLKDPKSHQARQVWLGPSLARTVRGHLARQQMRAHTARVEMVEDPFLFSRDLAGAEPWLPDYVSKRFKALWAQTKAPHARLHDLRHYHATELVDAGVPLVVIKERLGHSNVSVTSRYAHGREDADQAAAVAFEGRRHLLP